ncbi:hypothetical protein GC425_00395 [Corynebacterium sp. zg254]|uniref:hypothetical protein n=1 Tax=Corynebacterium TaxID=1716 RepID=UPI00125CC9F9|nr:MULTISPECIES: hypothetical protein [Corynebacterium]MCR5913335.1 hypothetical protein [Corynebacterium sp. zg254]
MFKVHTEVFAEQEAGSAFVLNRIYDGSDPFLNMGLSKVIPQRNLEPIHNLAYTTPPGVAEATMPLQALIAMFTSDDAAPLMVAEQWRSVGNQLETALQDLHNASTSIGLNLKGLSFDAARSAIQDITSMGEIVVANTRIMEQSVRQFPVVRATNLSALQAIQASTAAIPEQAERIAAEQAAVATYVTSTLQPSLELVKPPVVNLGVPVAGHTGGGSLSAYASGTASGPVGIHHIGGNLSQATASDGSQAFASRAADAAQAAGHGNANAAQAATAPSNAPVQVPAAAAHVNPSGTVSAAGAGAHAGTPTPAMGLGAHGGGLHASGQGHAVSTHAASTHNLTHAMAPVGHANSQLGVRMHQEGAAHKQPSSNTMKGAVSGKPAPTPSTGMAPTPGFGGAPHNQFAQPGQRFGSPRLPQLPYSATNMMNGQSAGMMNGQGAYTGAGGQAGAGAGVRGGTSAMMSPGAGGPANRSALSMGGNGGSSRATSGFGGFAGAGMGRGSGSQSSANAGSSLKANSVVREYFLREFMGKRETKRTVNRVITRG